MVNQYCAHSFARNWQLPFLNQRKGENDRRKYFMINLHERMLPTSAGVEPATSWSPVVRRIQLSHRGRLWCPSAFCTSLPGLGSFLLGSNGLFHVLIPPPGFTTPTVGPSCAKHLLSCLEQTSLDVVPGILRGSISYTCRCTHMQVEDLLEIIAGLRVFKLPNFKVRGELALGFWWSLSAWLHFPTCRWWDGCHVS